MREIKEMIELAQVGLHHKNFEILCIFLSQITVI